MSLEKPKQEFDTKILYLCIHKRLYDRVKNIQTKEIEKREFHDVLGRVYHIPKKLWVCIMKEMEDMDMIQNMGSRNNNMIKIHPLFIDPEEQVNMLYQTLKIF
jgi:hypothetical protein